MVSFESRALTIRQNRSDTSIHHSMGSAPVGAKCLLTSSLGEFLGYRDLLWYSGHAPVFMFIALPFAFHISVFSIHSSSPAIGFHSSTFYGGGICTTTNPPPYSRLGTGTMVIGYPKMLRYHGGGVEVILTLTYILA